MEYSSRCSCLMFKKLRSRGPIGKWNRQNPDKGIRERDRIVAVNGERAMSMQLLTWVKGFDDKIELTISRPHPLAGEEVTPTTCPVSDGSCTPRTLGSRTTDRPRVGVDPEKLRKALKKSQEI